MPQIATHSTVVPSTAKPTPMSIANGSRTDSGSALATLAEPPNVPEPLRLLTPAVTRVLEWHRRRTERAAADVTGQTVTVSTQET